MKFSKGNGKIGSDCFVVSRAVGDTCPSSCTFLNNGCYAQKTEKIFKNARKVGITNILTNQKKIELLLEKALKKGFPIRWHERGDFYNNGKLDLNYIKNIKAACEAVQKRKEDLPMMWTYTHIYDKRILDNLSKYVKIYASVHDKKELEKAKKAGFKLFAWCDTDRKFAPKKNTRKSPQDQYKSVKKVNNIEGEKFVTCPEMLKGRKDGGITCVGSKTTKACNLCVKGTVNILFLEH